MNVGIDVGSRKVTLQVLSSGGGALTATAQLEPEDALIVAETMKQCAETLIRESSRRKDRLQQDRENAPN